MIRASLAIAKLGYVTGEAGGVGQNARQEWLRHLLRPLFAGRPGIRFFCHLLVSSSVG
jgi:hypothetical protein